MTKMHRARSGEEDHGASMSSPGALSTQHLPIFMNVEPLELDHLGFLVEISFAIGV